MPDIAARFVGVELYFDDLDRAKKFYTETIGIRISNEQPGDYAKFWGEVGFICLERKGSEPYPSEDKAVVFFEVPDLETAIAKIGDEKVVQRQTGWAVIHDPEGHNVLLLQAGSERRRPTEAHERQRFLLGDNERRLPLQFAGFNLFFDNLERASKFYSEVIGLRIDDEDEGCFVAFRIGTTGFFCLYQKESPTDKAILCFNTHDIVSVVKVIGEDRFIYKHPRSAALNDPEGHTVSIVEIP